MGLDVRKYGASGPDVVLLHGGPGAAGYVAPVGRGLADSFRVVEPFQRGAGEEPLTVARHIEDLREILESHCGGRSAGLVGHSWGAMLALAYASAYPETVACLALIGCGTFDTKSRECLESTRHKRMDDHLTRRMRRLEGNAANPDKRMLAMGALFQRIDSHDLLPVEDAILHCDARANAETWQDMMRLQAEGVYPSAFLAIGAPAIMLHGAMDSHPGRMIHASLVGHIPQLSYREWESCGHYPWLEREARDDFFAELRAWLTANMGSGANGP